MTIWSSLFHLFIYAARTIQMLILHHLKSVASLNTQRIAVFKYSELRFQPVWCQHVLSSCDQLWAKITIQTKIEQREAYLHKSEFDEFDSYISSTIDYILSRITPFLLDFIHMTAVFSYLAPVWAVLPLFRCSDATPIDRRYRVCVWSNGNMERPNKDEHCVFNTILKWYMTFYCEVAYRRMSRVRSKGPKRVMAITVSPPFMYVSCFPRTRSCFYVFVC